MDEESLAKANCFMASPLRIDERQSLRMYVFDKNAVETEEGGRTVKKYLGRPMTVAEREKIMGFPEGYVEKAVHVLFAELLDNGINHKDWRKGLDPKYHHFAGNYHKLQDAEPYKFVFIEEGLMGQVRMKMAPPPSGRRPVSLSFVSLCVEKEKHVILMERFVD